MPAPGCSVFKRVKRLITKIRWKRWIYQRSRRELAKRQRRADQSVFRHLMRAKNSRPTLTVKLPPNFSLIESPDEVIAFCNQIRLSAQTNHLRFDLSEISRLTMDGIAVFIATLNERFIRHTTKISGNEPKDPALKELLDASGFYHLVHRRTGSSIKEQGRIVRYPKCQELGRTRFNKEVAVSLVDHAASFGQFPQAKIKRCYAAIEELMENTVQHASTEGRAKEPWWASVFFDKNRGVACFTFNDNGVGIFRSLRYGQIVKLYIGSPFRDAGDRLERMLSGEVRSRTNLPWRGEGLPGIQRDCKRRLLERLIVITNSAYGDVGTGSYRELSAEFKGTFFYWEISTEWR
jgi:hypothetical protein